VNSDRKATVVFFGITAGVVFTALYIVLVVFGVSPFSYEYTQTSYIERLANLVVIGFFVFLLGSYVGTTFCWLLYKRDSNYVYILYLLGWFIGLLASIVLISILFLSTQATKFVFAEKNIWTSLIVIGLLLLPIVFAWLGSRFTTKLEKKIPKVFKKRLIICIVGFIIFALPILIYSFTKRSDFPYKGSIEERHKWALKEFTDYPTAVEYIEKSELIKNDVGEKIKLAPATNEENYHVRALGDPGITVLTLEVLGGFGRGICKIEISRQYEEEKDSNNRKKRIWNPRVYKFNWELKERF